jgi:hypothetical protein
MENMLILGSVVIRLTGYFRHVEHSLTRIIVSDSLLRIAVQEMMVYFVHCIIILLIIVFT